MTKNTTILYIHGGGYVMGDKDDLPDYLTTTFKDLGYNLVGVNYPLAPQAQYEEILDYVLDRINTIEGDYILFGRSAGANIILSLDKNKLKNQPKKLILFYGYPSTDLSWMTQEITNLNMPYDNDLIVRMSEHHEVLYSRPLEEAYSYYYALRKSGQWPGLIGIKKTPITLDSTTPILIAHSIFDPDVPYHNAKTIRSYFTNNTMITSTSKKHAFDHDESEMGKFTQALKDFL